MFKIGLFAKMNRVTVKTLRYYDEVGLLKPGHIDRDSGYRYYSAAQIPTLHQIISLKQAGFSIHEISAIIAKSISSAEMVTILEERVAVHQDKLDHIKAYLTFLKGELYSMEHDIIIKELPRVIVASKRTVVPNYDAFFQVVPEMGEIMKKQGAKCAQPEYCFNIYHDGAYKESDIDVEICEAVVEARPDSEGVVYKTIERIDQAACILHKGPYSTIGNTYGIIMKWVEDNGYSISADPRESYIDGIWNKDNPADWLTEIQVPIKR